MKPRDFTPRTPSSNAAGWLHCGHATSARTSAGRIARCAMPINRGEVAGPRMQVVGFTSRFQAVAATCWIPGVPEGRHTGARAHGSVTRAGGVCAQCAASRSTAALTSLKVIASGAVLRLWRRARAAPEMTPEEIAAVVKVAHAAGQKVAAHAHGAQSIREAILAGADTIEHASLIDDAGIELALRASRRPVDGRLQRRLHRHRRPPDEVGPEEFLRNNLETTEAQRQGFTRALTPRAWR